MVGDPDARLTVTQDGPDDVAGKTLIGGPVFDLTVAEPAIDAVAAGADPDGALPIGEDGADGVEGEAVASVEGSPAGAVPAGDAGVCLGEEVAVDVFDEGEEACPGIRGEAVGDVACGEAVCVGSEDSDVPGAASPEPAVAIEEEIGPGLVRKVLLGA